jgi:hypothetical protein
MAWLWAFTLVFRAMRGESDGFDRHRQASVSPRHARRAPAAGLRVDGVNLAVQASFPGPRRTTDVDHGLALDVAVHRAAHGSTDDG